MWDEDVLCKGKPTNRSSLFCFFSSFFLSSYVFCGSGEIGPGVLVPSRLCTGTENWLELRTDGNYGDRGCKEYQGGKKRESKLQYQSQPLKSLCVFTYILRYLIAYLFTHLSTCLLAYLFRHSPSTFIKNTSILVRLCRYLISQSCSGIKSCRYRLRAKS